MQGGCVTAVVPGTGWPSALNAARLIAPLNPTIVARLLCLLARLWSCWRAFGPADAAGKRRMQEMIDVVVAMVSTRLAGSRFGRLLEASKASKMHDYLLLAGPIGALIVSAAELPEDESKAYTDLLHVLGDMWAKVQTRCVG
jgi:hypothetical protein